VRKPKQQTLWTMPAWMENYRRFIVNTGGNSVEELVNGHTSPIVNLPLSTLEACVKSQVALLQQLHGAGLVAGGILTW
jgi:hypothetical protein